VRGRSHAVGEALRDAESLAARADELEAADHAGGVDLSAVERLTGEAAAVADRLERAAQCATFASLRDLAAARRRLTRTRLVVLDLLADALGHPTRDV
jgi:hypothetical protein